MLSLEKRMLAALKVHVLWSWLETHPDKWKADYPLLKEIIINRPYSSLCPWCDIYNGCRDCPLGVVGNWCGNRSGWFQMWDTTGKRYRSLSLEKQRTAMLDDRSRAAGEIANIAWNEYKRCELLSD